MVAPLEICRVYEPYRRGFPPIREYLAESWARRDFVLHLARFERKAEHYDTTFGQLWNLLNPLLLAGVYYLLLGVIMDSPRGGAEFFSYLVAGLFMYNFTRSTAQSAVRSLISGEQLILNTAFPRIVLPSSSMVSGLLAFLPTCVVWFAIHAALGRPFGWGFLLLPVLILALAVFNLGLALLISIVTVYFRDTTGFLPYVLRIWLYMTPVLYLVNDVPDHLVGFLRVNPLYPAFAGLQDIVGGGAPSVVRMLAALGWAVAMLLIGGAAFLYKERDVAAQF